MRTRPRPSSGGTGTRTGAGPSPAQVTVVVTVVESEACHFCADAQQVLLDAAVSYPLEVRSFDLRSPEGQAMMQKHRATMSPLVLLDGEFFSNGRLPRRKLAKVLAHRFAGTTVTGRPVARVGADRG